VPAAYVPAAQHGGFRDCPPSQSQGRRRPGAPPWCAAALVPGLVRRACRHDMPADDRRPADVTAPAGTLPGHCRCQGLVHAAGAMDLSATVPGTCPQRRCQGLVRRETVPGTCPQRRCQGLIRRGLVSDGARDLSVGLVRRAGRHDMPADVQPTEPVPSRLSRCQGLVRRAAAGVLDRCWCQGLVSRDLSAGQAGTVPCRCQGLVSGLVSEAAGARDLSADAHGPGECGRFRVRGREACPRAGPRVPQADRSQQGARPGRASGPGTDLA
jgi:hypothetical protein